ncbi:alpha-1,6-mannosylglycoprotein 6-beta-N-acetylglucosaminyltransferase A-like protein [Cricetulus griseus]|nr:alpha-1,6-mannosylglycoprotein 6-beta-N-acetylglucosaminyltransferase A-like protein [Cricetulus griseus]
MAFFTPWKLSSQKLGFFLVTFGFIWGMMLLHFTIQQRTQPESSSMLREQILDLSKRYIKALAEENRNVVDGPYAGVMTAYDLKKTLAVLLDNILQRIGKLESKVDNLVNGTGANSTNSTTAVPSLVSLEKISVADKELLELSSTDTIQNIDEPCPVTEGPGQTLMPSLFLLWDLVAFKSPSLRPGYRVSGSKYQS